MSTFKRGAFIAVVACTSATAVLFALILWHPGGAVLASTLRDVPVLLGLASLVALLALAGAVGGIVRIVQTFTHVAARLSANETGSISIEKSALVSVAQGALARIPNLSVQRIAVDVVPKRGSAVLDVDVLASPLGTQSLMALATSIQTEAKRALEAFTEHEVRYVSVKFVESHRRGESLADEGGKRSAKPAPAPEVREEPAPAPTPQPAEPAVARPTAEAPEKASLWSRAKARAGRLRARVDDDGPVMTQAVVTDAAEEPVSGEEASAADGEPTAESEVPEPAESEVTEPVEADDADVAREGDEQEVPAAEAPEDARVREEDKGDAR